MLKIIFVLFTAIFCSNIFASNWKEIYPNIHIDLDSITEVQDSNNYFGYYNYSKSFSLIGKSYISAWFNIEYDNPQTIIVDKNKKTYNSIKILSRINCTSKEIASSRYIYFYTRKDRVGNAVYDDIIDNLDIQRKENLIPDSIEEIQYNSICKYFNKRKNKVEKNENENETENNYKKPKNEYVKHPI